MIRKASIILLILLTLLTCFGLSMTIGGKPTATNEQDADSVILCEAYNTEVVLKTITPGKFEFDIDEVSLYLRDKTTHKEDLLLTTVPLTSYYWYIPDGNKFYPVSIDSIPAVSDVYIYNYQPLQLIIEGCPDYRNIFSYFIDVESKKAWYIPANCGYMGQTEEGYMIFSSYRYVSDLDIAGRYTFIQVFDETGNMVDSLDLEHVILDKYYHDEKE